MYAKEALDCGLVNKVADSQEAVLGNLNIIDSDAMARSFINIFSRSI